MADRFKLDLDKIIDEACNLDQGVCDTLRHLVDKKNVNVVVHNDTPKSSFHRSQQIILTIIVKIAFTLVVLQSVKTYSESVSFLDLLSMSRSEKAEVQDALVNLNVTVNSNETVFQNVTAFQNETAFQNVTASQNQPLFVTFQQTTPLFYRLFPGYRNTAQMVVQDFHPTSVKMFLESLTNLTPKSVEIKDDSVHVRFTKAGGEKFSTKLYIVNIKNNVTSHASDDDIIFVIPSQTIIDSAKLHLLFDNVPNVSDISVSFMDKVNFIIVHEGIEIHPLLSVLMIFAYVYTKSRQSWKEISIDILHALILIALISEKSGVIIHTNSPLYEVVDSIGKNLRILNNIGVQIDYDRETKYFTLGGQNSTADGLSSLMNDYIKEKNEVIIVGDLFKAVKGYKRNALPDVYADKQVVKDRLDDVAVLMLKRLYGPKTLYKFNENLTITSVDSSDDLYRHNSEMFALWKVSLSQVEFDEDAFYIKTRLDQIVHASMYDIIPGNFSGNNKTIITDAIQFIYNPNDNIDSFIDNMGKIPFENTKVENVYNALLFIRDNKSIWTQVYKNILGPEIPNYIASELNKKVNQEVLHSYNIVGDKTSMEFILHLHNIDILLLSDHMVSQIERDYGIKSNKNNTRISVHYPTMDLT